MARVAITLCAAVVAVAALLIDAPAALADGPVYVYADATSDSPGCGGSAHSACKTIQYAIDDVANPGDTIEVGAGTYNDPVSVTKSVTLTDVATEAPVLTQPITVGDATGSVTISGLSFSDAGAIDINGNTGPTTVSGNTFDNVTGPAISLTGPAPDSGLDPMSVTVSANTGNVPAGAQPIAMSGKVAVTTDDEPNAIDIGGANVNLSSPPTDLTTDESPTTVPVSASAGTALDNARLDVCVVADASAASSPVGVSVQDAGSLNSIALTGSNGAFAGALTSATPLASGGTLSPYVRVAALSAPAVAPTITLSLDEIVDGDVLNTVAASYFSPTLHANSPPAYDDETVTMAHGDSSVGVTLAAKDADGDALDYAYTQPAAGTGSVTGTGANLTFTAPAGGLQAPTTFTYAVTDGYSTPASQTITINPPPNAAPVLDTASQSITLNAQVFSTQNITLNASDPDGDSLTFAASNTALRKVAANTFAYTAPATAVGHTLDYTVTVTDPYGGKAVSHIAISVDRATSHITGLWMSPQRPSSSDRPTVTVDVTSAGDESGGVVTIRTGGFGTPSAPVVGGVASIKLPRFPGGHQSITAVFAGTTTAAPQTSKELPFTVTRVASRIGFTTNPLQLTTRTNNATATVTVTAGPFRPSGGIVTIDENGNRLAQGTPRVGVVTLRLPRFSLGQHNLTVSYTGTDSITASSALEIERVGLG